MLTRSYACFASKTFSVHKLNALSWLDSISFFILSSVASSSSWLTFLELWEGYLKQYLVCSLVWFIIATINKQTKRNFFVINLYHNYQKWIKSQNGYSVKWKRVFFIKPCDLSSSSLMVLRSLWSSAGNVLASLNF